MNRSESTTLDWNIGSMSTTMCRISSRSRSGSLVPTVHRPQAVCVFWHRELHPGSQARSSTRCPDVPTLNPAVRCERASPSLYSLPFSHRSQRPNDVYDADEDRLICTQGTLSRARGGTRGPKLNLPARCGPGTPKPRNGQNETDAHRGNGVLRLPSS